MFVVTIINCVLIIVSGFLDENSDEYLTIKLMDDIFFAIYSIEFVLKIIGYGIKGYFDDIWNKFDLFLLVF